MMDIEWVDEPPMGNPGRSRSRALRAFGDELRNRPGCWAKYPWEVKQPTSSAYAINTGRFTALGPHVQAVARGGIVYVRYNPEQ